MKGEIRQAVMVMFQDKQSWKYRHWFVSEFRIDTIFADMG